MQRTILISGVKSSSLRMKRKALDSLAGKPCSEHPGATAASTGCIPAEVKNPKVKPSPLKEKESNKQSGNRNVVLDAFKQGKINPNQSLEQLFPNISNGEMGSILMDIGRELGVPPSFRAEMIQKIINKLNRIDPMDVENVGRYGPIEIIDDYRVKIVLQRGELYDASTKKMTMVYRWAWVNEGQLLEKGNWTKDRQEAKDAGQVFGYSKMEEYREDDETDYDEIEDGRIASEFESEGYPVDESDNIVRVLSDDDLLKKTLGLPDDARPVKSSKEIAKWEGHYSDDLPLDAAGIEINFKHPKLDTWRVFVGVDGDGKKFIKFDLIQVKSEYKNSGVGSEIVNKCVEEASKQGFDYIQLHAAGQGGAGGFNGYYTWPRLGWDCDLDRLAETYDQLDGNTDFVDELRSQFPDADSVLDILKTKDGLKWWKAHGRDIYDARFDLSEGSRSRDVLDAYIKERKERNAAPKKTSE